MSQADRPLSPHLQVYKPQMTSVLSITHRVTGVALVLGTILIACVLIAAAMGQEAYKMVMGLVATTIGKVLLFGWTVALYFHLCNGIRHLFWDMGYLFKLKNAYRAGYIVLIATFLLTVGTWMVVFDCVPCLIAEFFS